MYEQLVHRIEYAFDSVKPSEAGMRKLTPSECHDAVDDLLIYRQEDLHWILPQILVYLLQSFEQKKAVASDVGDVVRDLDVTRTWFTDDPPEIGDADYKAYRSTAKDMVREGRLRAYANFTPTQAQAIVEFLEAVQDWPNAFFGKACAGAKKYWQDRSSENSQGSRPVQPQKPK